MTSRKRKQDEETEAKEPKQSRVDEYEEMNKRIQEHFDKYMHGIDEDGKACPTCTVLDHHGMSTMGHDDEEQLPITVQSSQNALEGTPDPVIRTVSRIPGIKGVFSYHVQIRKLCSSTARVTCTIHARATKRDEGATDPALAVIIHNLSDKGVGKFLVHYIESDGKWVDFERCQCVIRTFDLGRGGITLDVSGIVVRLQ